MILARAVDIILSAAVRTQTFKDALATSVRLNPTLKTINLVVDGGSENNNQTVDEFLASINNIRINKIRALKDVRFSNAMAEATNRILKTDYLNRQDIYDTAALLHTTGTSVLDVNEVRPHGQLSGLIPVQAYQGAIVNKTAIAKQVSEARKRRTEINRQSACPGCKF